MKKEFTVKIFKQKAGAHYPDTYEIWIWGGYNKKDAFKKGREELIRIANCDLVGGLSESSEEDILQEIKSIKNGANNYYYDVTNYFFKVFSKKCKN